MNLKAVLIAVSVIAAIALVVCSVSLIGRIARGIGNRSQSNGGGPQSLYTGKPEIKLDTPSGKKNAPSKDVITEDVKNALASENPHASLTKVETVKSSTEETVFAVTLDIEAQSRYADWNYELYLYYRKYDQGWMLDHTQWPKSNYEVTRQPSSEEMVAYASEYLPSSAASHSHAGDFMLPITNPSMNFGFNDSIDKTVIELSWDAVEPDKYCAHIYRIVSLWEYDAESDTWELTENADDSYLDDSYSGREIYNLDYSGEWEVWDALNNGRNLRTTMSISGFSRDGFYVDIPELTDGKEYFYATTENPPNAESWQEFAFIYKSDHGNYVAFNVAGRVISIWNWFDEVVAYGEIKADLPELTN